ncbi:MAG: hypothetical protein OXC40_00790 [Proteobacteria bacterium]|nr:hypothetical protein [Pseudomonadota bacterium]
MILNKQSDRRKSRQRAKKGNRRGGFFSMLVEPYVQIRLGALIFLLNILFGLLISAVFYYYVVDIHDAVSVYFKLTQDQNQENWQKFFLPFVVCLSLVVSFFILTFFIIIRYTHQIYGPLISIHNFLDQLISRVDHQDNIEENLGTESIKPLEVRSSDQLVSLADKLNKLQEKISAGK